MKKLVIPISPILLIVITILSISNYKLLSKLFDIKYQIQLIDRNTTSTEDKVRDITYTLIRLELEYGNLSPDIAKLYKKSLDKYNKEIIDKLPK